MHGPVDVRHMLSVHECAVTARVGSVWMGGGGEGVGVRQSGSLLGAWADARRACFLVVIRSGKC